MKTFIEFAGNILSFTEEDFEDVMYIFGYEDVINDDTINEVTEYVFEHCFDKEALVYSILISNCDPEGIFIDDITLFQDKIIVYERLDVEDAEEYRNKIKSLVKNIPIEFVYE